MTTRESQIRRTLWIALSGNLLVAVAKLIYGLVTGTLAVIADGVHSAVDAAGSVIGLLSLRVARRPSDGDHHYGHHKFETVAALAIGAFIALAAWEVTKGAVDRLLSGGLPAYYPAGPAIIVVTLVFNLALSQYERTVGKRTGSSLLNADALHTRSDVFVSVVVLASLFGLRAGLRWLDPVVSMAIAAYLGWIAFRVLEENVLELTDAAFLDTDRIETIAREVPGVIDCHKVRTRGRAGAAFVDLHIQIAPETDTVTSHRIVHDVGELIMQRIPGVREVLIHTEPFPDLGPASGNGRSNRLPPGALQD